MNIRYNWIIIDDCGYWFADCTGCRKEIVDGQALIALDQQWHVWCFKCSTCNALLHGEYMGKDGLPYCEKDYQRQFGVKCDHCERFIAGKVLQAGDNHHFHPTCARCSKCGDPFGDGEEMYLQGTAIWHPRCGPGPGQSSNGNITLYLNGPGQNQGQDEKDDRISSSAASEFQFSMRSRTSSINGSVCHSPYGSMHKKVPSCFNSFIFYYNFCCCWWIDWINPDIVDEGAEICISGNWKIKSLFPIKSI